MSENIKLLTEYRDKLIELAAQVKTSILSSPVDKRNYRIIYWSHVHGIINSLDCMLLTMEDGDDDLSPSVLESIKKGLSEVGNSVEQVAMFDYRHVATTSKGGSA